MKVLVATTFYIVKIGDSYYAKSAFSSIIRRYCDFFGKLVLCIPVRDNDDFTANYEEITDMVDKVIPVTREDAIFHRKDKIIKDAIYNVDLVIARCHSNVAFLASDIAHKLGKPVMAEAMSCAWDAYWNHGVLGKIVAPYMYLKMKNVLKNADYALYVTEEFLQKRYPCNKLTVGVSDVVISDIGSDVVLRRKNTIKTMDRNNITLMTCAAVDVYYKGQHFVIRAIPLLNKMGIRVKYYCVGQGNQSYLKNIARKCGVEDQIVFTGAVSHDQVFEYLDQCDIYLQPSLQEGLPRALVEAMSRGCPCIGAKTAGIPELIDEECLVKRKSVKEIASTVQRMLKSGLQGYSERNFERANNFKKESLDLRRNRYFEYIVQDLKKGVNYE